MIQPGTGAMDTLDNLYSLTTELDRAANVIQTLLLCVRDGISEPPAGLIEECEQSMATLVTWSLAIKQRIKN